MTSSTPSSTEYYNENSGEVFKKYMIHSTQSVHRHMLKNFPVMVASSADIGAGSGRDAGYLASRSEVVFAVEPAEDLLNLAKKSFKPKRNIEWVCDHLPCLKLLDGRSGTIDFVLASAVINHLDGREQRIAFNTLFRLLKKTGSLIITSRTGPNPFGRTMYSIEENQLYLTARDFGFQLSERSEYSFEEDIEAENKVSWKAFCFKPEYE